MKMEMFNWLSIPKTGKCQRKAIAPDSSAHPKYSQTTMGFRQAGVLATVGFFLGVTLSSGSKSLVLTRIYL